MDCDLKHFQICLLLSQGIGDFFKRHFPSTKGAFFLKICVTYWESQSEIELKQQ